ncbi:uncharacterized protein LOC110665414 isoform X2 [Hevea brasiliensis]|uniref:uncharacterized protein LOC110665414 isoform X2 n=1 Tax=Hevea brasiliensis TaxID=3981 RepID=UPI0025D78F70|nr:uncharacterized protein LOC110665414 isoform X2 [Hevea brasiliensis]XP_057984370.1 uncharacterized protein LOC110665414 isoform X2 [Hevea brasiliensis]XP_057984371.1 uncharacterized protein LOC110665414 isoform X2 [Hevea brasiliensis]
MRKDALSPPLQNGQQYSKQSRLYLPPLDDPKLHQQQELEEEEEDRYPTCHKKKMEMLKQNKTRNENSKPKRSNQRNLSSDSWKANLPVPETKDWIQGDWSLAISKFFLFQVEVAFRVSTLTPCFEEAICLCGASRHL